VVIDPYFHYHAPIEGISYILNNERTQNDGILRHFDYDALITGTSMSENFKTSLADELFDAHFVKAAYGGGYYREVCSGETTALVSRPGLKMVIRSVDQNFALYDKDYHNPEAPSPDYLYDQNVFNDVEYIFNKEVLFTWIPQIIGRTADGQEADSFDRYMRFAEDRDTGKAAVTRNIDHPGRAAQKSEGLSEDEEKMLRDSIEQNFLVNVKKYRDVQFYYYFPPFSSAYWYLYHVASGDIKKHIETLRIISEMLTPYENVHLFAFFEETDITMDLDNYSDLIHYSGDINDRILHWMAEDSHRITAGDIRDYFDRIEQIYTDYDYEEIYR
jgi:hypothetical protein